VKVLGIDIDAIADRCVEKIARHRHEMTAPDIEGALKEIVFHLERIAVALETRDAEE